MTFEDAIPNKSAYDFEESKIISYYYWAKLKCPRDTESLFPDWCPESKATSSVGKLQRLVIDTALGKHLQGKVLMGWNLTIPSVSDLVGVCSADIISDIISTAINYPSQLFTDAPTVVERVKLIQFILDSNVMVNTIINEVYSRPINEVIKLGNYDYDYLMGTLEYVYEEPEYLGLSSDWNDVIVQAIVARIKEEEDRVFQDN